MGKSIPAQFRFAEVEFILGPTYSADNGPVKRYCARNPVALERLNV
jgi:hypothetical protein